MLECAPAYSVAIGPSAAAAPVVRVSVASSGTDHTLVAAAGAGKRIRVLYAKLVATGACAIAFESGTGGTALTGDMNLAAAGSQLTLEWLPCGHFQTAANTLLNLEISANAVNGWLVYQVIEDI